MPEPEPSRVQPDQPKKRWRQFQSTGELVVFVVLTTAFAFVAGALDRPLGALDIVIAALAARGLTLVWKKLRPPATQ